MKKTWKDSSRSRFKTSKYRHFICFVHFISLGSIFNAVSVCSFALLSQWSTKNFISYWHGVCVNWITSTKYPNQTCDYAENIKEKHTATHNQQQFNTQSIEWMNEWKMGHLKRLCSIFFLTIRRCSCCCAVMVISVLVLAMAKAIYK